MNKPEKKIPSHNPEGWGGKEDFIDCGYNQACDDWEAYHTQEIKLLELFLKNTRNDLMTMKKSLPSKMEIIEILIFDKQIQKDLTELHMTNHKNELYVSIARAISKRIGG